MFRLKAPILRYFKGCTEGLKFTGDNYRVAIT
jgi:hypothetical protein